jgi:hypothetical protein
LITGPLMAKGGFGAILCIVAFLRPRPADGRGKHKTRRASDSGLLQTGAPNTAERPRMMATHRFVRADVMQELLEAINAPARGARARPSNSG